MTPPEARLATDSDVPAAAGALAAAFAEDPPMRWFMEGIDDVPELLRGYFGAILEKLYLPFGEIWVTDDPVGAALWAPPGRYPFSTREQLPTFRTLLRVFGRRPVRAITGNAAIIRDHPHDPHWYLEYIGVEPAGPRRRRRLGAAGTAP